jgi:hypothetical protein
MNAVRKYEIKLRLLRIFTWSLVLLTTAAMLALWLVGFAILIYYLTQ